METHLQAAPVKRIIWLTPEEFRAVVVLPERAQRSFVASLAGGFRGEVEIREHPGVVTRRVVEEAQA